LTRLTAGTASILTHTAIYTGTLVTLTSFAHTDTAVSFTVIYTFAVFATFTVDYGNKIIVKTESRSK
jgi:hypothetical protein